ncbi:MAG: DHHA1 domain-containing protein [Calditrichaceae bacterium]
MSDKLYYRNSYQRESTARILKEKTDDKGLWLQLDRNLFYPGGGGQLPDKGQIAGNELQAILEDEGIIWHCVNKNAALKENDEVQVEIDWFFRYGNMQQHSGQHLLSHVLWENGLKTVSVHLGENYTMIEVEGGFPNDELMNKVEDEANQLIRKAIAIKTFITDRKKAEKLPLRKPAGNWDELRIVEINGIDFSACGGTHVNNTSEIGLIKYLGTEKIRGHARLKFVTGESAYKYFAQLHIVTNQMKETLQTDPAQFPDKLNMLLEDLASYKKENNQLKKYYIQYLVNEILKNTEAENELIVFNYNDGNFEDIKEVSKFLANDYNKINFIYGNGRFSLRVPENNNFNASQFIREQGNNFTLKGGGPKDFIQGVYTNINQDELTKVLATYKKK